MKIVKLPMLFLLIAGFFTMAFLGCKKDLSAPTLTSNAKAKVLSAPTLACSTATPTSITITVCSGLSGAPAGFSVQWELRSDYDANIAAGGTGWPVNSDAPDNTSFCKASFSGVPGCSSYNLAGNTCSSIKIGDNLFDECGASSSCANTPLRCNTQYVFRAFAHNDPVSGAAKSVWSTTITCTTAPCAEGGPLPGCTLTQGYWKTHGPVPTGNNVNEWGLTSLTLGTVSYTDLQLQSIFDTPAGGNGLISLAHQLIAAKINILHGADASAIQSSIGAADALIGGLVVPPVGLGTLSPGGTSVLNLALTNYNEGVTGPGHCN